METKQIIINIILIIIGIALLFSAIKVFESNSDNIEDVGIYGFLSVMVIILAGIMTLHGTASIIIGLLEDSKGFRKYF